MLHLLKQRESKEMSDSNSTLFNRLPPTIPFEQEVTSSCASWILAFILYISLLATFATLIILAAIDYEQPGSTKTLTLVVPFKKASNLRMESQETYTEKRLATIINAVSETPKVIEVSLLSEQEMQRLLTPWFGKKVNAYAINIPTLINIRVNIAKEPFDTKSLLERLHSTAPKAAFLKKLSWEALIEQSSLKIQLFISGLLILILLAASSTISFITRTNMLMQKDIIELLTLLGATDIFIANRYKKRTLLIAFESLSKAIIGLMITIGFIWWSTYEFDHHLMGRVLWHLLSWKIIFLVLTPVITITIMLASTRRCVIKTLEELF